MGIVNSAEPTSKVLYSNRLPKYYTVNCVKSILKKPESAYLYVNRVNVNGKWFMKTIPPILLLRKV